MKGPNIATVWKGNPVHILMDNGRVIQLLPTIEVMTLIVGLKGFCVWQLFTPWHKSASIHTGDSLESLEHALTSLMG